MKDMREILCPFYNVGAGIRYYLLTYTNLSIILTYKILTRKILTRKILTHKILTRELLKERVRLYVFLS